MAAHEATFQVGDCGFEYDYLAAFDPRLHKVLPGNHENYGLLERQPFPRNILADRWGVTWDGKVGYLGGAWSIDKEARVPGFDWWSQEELPESELAAAIDLIASTKPPIVASHDCPGTIFGRLKSDDPGPFGASYRPTRTAEALSRLFSQYRPKLWVFGHHHVQRTFAVDGTEFHALRVLGTFEVDISVL
jgi:hypothetical protein